MNIKSRIVALLPQSTALHLRAFDHYINGEPELRLLKGLVDHQRQAIDAGANIGIYSYFLTKFAAEVHAYEPNPDLAAKLKALLPAVNVRQVALSDKPNSLTLSVPVDVGGRPSHELGSVAQTFTGDVQNFQVECITLDSENLSDVGFLKIDVEQHEREVLRGALDTIDRCRPVILIEVYPLRYARELPDEFDFILRRRGYHGWFWFNGQWASIDRFQGQIHASPEKFGRPREFMGNNLFLFPSEHPNAKIGPDRRA